MQKDPVSVPVISKELCDIKSEVKLKKISVKNEEKIVKKNKNITIAEVVQNKFIGSIFKNRMKSRLIL